MPKNYRHKNNFKLNLNLPFLQTCVSISAVLKTKYLMKNLQYEKDGNSAFIIKNESNGEIASVWIDSDELEIEESENVAKVFTASYELLDVVKELHKLLCEHEPNWYLKYHYNIAKKVLDKV